MVKKKKIMFTNEENRKFLTIPQDFGKVFKNML